MKLADLERGEGRMTTGKTTIIQCGNEDRYETHPATDGWTPRNGWHVAGSIAGPNAKKIDWCDRW